MRICKILISYVKLDHICNYVYGIECRCNVRGVCVLYVWSMVSHNAQDEASIKSYPVLRLELLSEHEYVVSQATPSNLQIPDQPISVGYSYHVSGQ